MTTTPKKYRLQFRYDEDTKLQIEIIRKFILAYHYERISDSELIRRTIKTVCNYILEELEKEKE